jgi:cysteinyl-tRNA synthetase
MAALGVDYRADPQFREPRATDFIPEMVRMIADLVARGHAYAAEGHVLFDVQSYPEYGRLSGRSVADMIAGARVEVAPYKRDPMDFVLWKPSAEDQPGWDSPWGRGRPGWHIECSAMSHALLGESFDIHGGGIDLQFPHHENEIAQSCCAHPEGGFARIWMHNEMLQVEGKKMSKSLGNFFTVRDLLDQGVPGEVIRFVMLSTHYSKPMDWTEKKREEAERTLRRWRRLLDGAQSGDVDPVVLNALADDLNTAGAIARMFDLEAAGEADALLASANLLGLMTDDLADWDWRRVVQDFGAVQFVGSGDEANGAIARDIAESWQRLRAEKRFSEADALREKAHAAGLQLRALSGAVQAEALGSFDPTKLEALR